MNINRFRKQEETDTMTRIAIVEKDRCKPKNCGLACKKSCPVVRMGKQCIVVETNSKIADISEALCIGCGICVKKCPYDAIKIINLPSNLSKDTTHRYSKNSFKLHRLPVPRSGEVLGLVGTNGIGKSTALKILAGKVKPNLGKYEAPPDWPTILTYFRGSELQNYFTKILEDNLKAVVKPQYVDQIARAVQGKVIDLLKKRCDRDNIPHLLAELELEGVKDRMVDQLSGGELQRFAIAMCLVQKADVYMFDEPSSYLDVKQRLKAAEMIRDLVEANNYVIVVEHDLAILDYLSDYVCCLYGVPGAYGVVTLPSGVREGINIFLDGFIPTENMRFRDSQLSFKVTDQLDKEVIERVAHYQYPALEKTLGNFHLSVEEGEFTDSEIVVLLGENGTGKTTLIRILAGVLKVDDENVKVPSLNISYKPQKISPKSTTTVRHMLQAKIPDMYQYPQFKTDVMNPLMIDNLFDQEVQNLSGGELQRVALALCLGKAADVYLIDEPSAYLDAEQRLVAAKVIKRFILHAKKTAFIVEHDFIMATYLADRVINFEGKPSVSAHASKPQSLVLGMNRFLKQVDVTYRKDKDNYRPRINKKDSVKDIEQKRSGNFFFLDDD
uniref:ATP-binding cassette sub-family E member 1 n=1 Tax=Syphacia muris TaxID=451379 RepID=A0A0N5AL29_9BILA